MKTKTSKLFSFVSALAFALIFVACNNNPNIEKPNRIVSSDSNPNLDSVSTDILKDPIPTTTATVKAITNEDDNEPTNNK